MRRILAAATIAALLAGPAAAACYEDIGCTDSDYYTQQQLAEFSCNALWELRNTIYHERGACFKSERAIAFFGNEQCHVDDFGDIAFSRVEQTNVDTIVAVEKRKGCR